MTGYGGEVYRMACLELLGGNMHATYAAELPGLLAWVSCRPLTPAIHGGDLHYLSVCGGGVVSRIALADVVGNGEAVSSIADRLTAALRVHANGWDQSLLMKDLNDSFLHGASSVEYATAFVLSYYAQSGELLFTNAGHPPPLWYRSSEREWSLMVESTPFAKEVQDLPLGLIPGTPYSQTAVELGSQDIIVLYTDGVTESRNPNGEMLGQLGLLSLARGLPLDSPVRIGQAVLSAVRTFRDALPAEDDETLLVLQRQVPLC